MTWMLIKYGNKQPIQVSIKSLGDKVQFAVKDHGMGISPDHIDKIFNRFYQIISASSQGGLGIGLFISKQIVKAHEGSIFVQSELNKGSTFTVELPKNPINLKEGYNV
jgi:signal transduction histidine kinase